MFAGAGAASFSSYAGLARAEGSRSWRSLIVQPPAPAEGVNLSWAAASIDTPMGLVATAWWAAPAEDADGSAAAGAGAAGLGVGAGAGARAPAPSYALNATVPVGARAQILVPSVVPPSSARVTILESGAPVWRNGSFLPAAGLFGGAASSLGVNSVNFSAGSGSFAFVVQLD